MCDVIGSRDVIDNVISRLPLFRHFPTGPLVSEIGLFSLKDADTHTCRHTRRLTIKECLKLVALISNSPALIQAVVRYSRLKLFLKYVGVSRRESLLLAYVLMGTFSALSTKWTPVLCFTQTIQPVKKLVPRITLRYMCIIKQLFHSGER